MTEKRSRGRPIGTTINDEMHLDAIADLMVRDLNLKKTPAVAKIVNSAFPEHKWQAAERRMLRKWNESANKKMEAAQQRLQERRSKPVVRRGSPTRRSFVDIKGLASDAVRAISVFCAIRDMIDPPAIRFIREHMKERERIRDLVDPPALRQFRKQNEMIQNAFRPFDMQ